MPISFDFSIDATVLAYALLISAGTALLFGLLPAWSSSRPDLVRTLKELAGDDARRRITLRSALVVGQLALSLVLLVAGALLSRALLAAHGTDLGYDPRVISSLGFNLQMNGYSVERAAALRDRVLENVRGLPGVVAADVASRLPLAPDINVTGVTVPGRDASADGDTLVDVVRVGADYFRAVDVPIVRGRAFSRDEIAAGRRVAIVNETMARQLWPDGGAIGARVHTEGIESEPYVVVGIAQDHKVRSVGEHARPYLHLPYGPSRAVGLVVRTTMPAEMAMPMLRQAVWALEPDVVFTEDVSAAQVAETTMAPTRIGALVIGTFGVLALLLATIGLYGVIAFGVSRRRREIGIRMALGARRSQVLRLILWQGGRLALIGIAIGSGAAILVGRLLESLLYGVPSSDPVAFGAAAALLFLVAISATVLPAHIAARIDPVRAVKSE